MGNNHSKNEVVFIPVPDYQQQKLSARTGNFSLAFPRMAEWSAAGSKSTKGMESLCRMAGNMLPGANSALQRVHQRQEALLNNWKQSNGEVLQFRMQLSSALISGLGSGHPHETGLVLDRNTGVPYLPASSIKGVMRLAYALELAERDPSVVEPDQRDPKQLVVPDKHLRKYFGDTESGEGMVRGQVVFLDAFPEKAECLQLDIMNPHYSGYYHGDTPPVENKNPLPVKFISVKPGTVFVFRLMVDPLLSRKYVDNNFAAEDRAVLSAVFERACTQLGFGAKTAAGYGRFEAAKNKQQKSVQTDRDTVAVHSKPAQVAVNLKTGQSVECILLEEKTKKGGWRAAVRSNQEICGAVQNHGEVAADKKPGDSLMLKIVVVSGGNSQFRI